MNKWALSKILAAENLPCNLVQVFKSLNSASENDQFKMHLKDSKAMSSPRNTIK